MADIKPISVAIDHEKVKKEIKEKEKTLRNLLADLDCARVRADREGWTDAGKAERMLGVSE